MHQGALGALHGLLAELAPINPRLLSFVRELTEDAGVRGPSGDPNPWALQCHDVLHEGVVWYPCPLRDVRKGPEPKLPEIYLPLPFVLCLSRTGRHNGNLWQSRDSRSAKTPVELRISFLVLAALCSSPLFLSFPLPSLPSPPQTPSVAHLGEDQVNNCGVKLELAVRAQF